MRFEKEINIYGDEVVLKRFLANETSIDIAQGKISAVISESELVELQNSSATMYSKLASAVMQIDALELNFSDLTAKYNIVSGQYSSLDSKVAQYKASVDELSADITSVQQNLSKNYSTTSQMNSAINAKAGEITAEVSAVKTTLQNDYSTTTDMNAAINAKVNELSLSVSSRLTSLENWKSEASLKITDSAIVSTVTSSSTYKNSVDSLIEQKASSIRMKAEQISWESTYSSMTSTGKLTCKGATIEGTIHSDNGDNEIYMRSARMDFIRGGTEIGVIGTNNISGKPTIKGLVFDLEYGNSYMAFARKDSSTADTYTIKLAYYPNANMADNAYKGWYFSDDIYTNGNYMSLDRNARTYTHGYSNGASIITKDTFWIENGSGSNIAQFSQNDVIIAKDLYANLVGTPSDERLKTNIRNCSISALDIINALPFMEYDWIESGRHERIGLIAQDIETVAADLVSENKDIKTINPLRLLWYCAKSIQEISQGVGKSKGLKNMKRNDMTLTEKKTWIENNRAKNRGMEDLRLQTKTVF